MTQPPNSGAPQPVQGVTGGPPVLGGQIGNDPNSGNVVINPNPGNAVEIKKSPSAFNVYEFFNSNTDNVRLTMATQLGGPETMGIVTAPSSVNRDLNITAGGNGHVLIPALQLQSYQLRQASISIGLGAGTWQAVTTPVTVIAGVYLVVITGYLQVPAAGSNNGGFLLADASANTGGTPNYGVIGFINVPLPTSAGNPGISIAGTGIATIPATSVVIQAYSNGGGNSVVQAANSCICSLLKIG